MKNAEWMIKNGYKFSDVRYCFTPDYTAVSFYLNEKIIGKAAGKSYLAAFAEWLDMEHEDEKQILTSTEREYLNAFIKPFRDRIRGIEKDEYAPDNTGFLYFYMDNNDDFCLPYFQMGTMYKGMDAGIEYTLKELDLR